MDQVPSSMQRKSWSPVGIGCWCCGWGAEKSVPDHMDQVGVGNPITETGPSRLSVLSMPSWPQSLSPPTPKPGHAQPPKRQPTQTPPATPRCMDSEHSQIHAHGAKERNCWTGVESIGDSREMGQTSAPRPSARHAIKHVATGNLARSVRLQSLSLVLKCLFGRVARCHSTPNTSERFRSL